jgi:fermentation-respiration switch protein FrsA (DUF1100 family)
MAKMLQQLGHSAFRMNITRKVTGDGFEIPTITQEISQAKAMVQLLKEKYKRVVVSGHSQGWMSALQLCHDKVADAAVCIMGVIDTDVHSKSKLDQLGVTFDKLKGDGYASMQLDHGTFLYTPEFFDDFQSFDVPAIIAATRTPLLFIFGTEDATITPAEVMRGFEAANEPKALVAIEATHRFDEKAAAAIALNISEWISKVLA